VFVVDETGFVEIGPRSAEVQRQYVTVRSVTPSSNGTVAAVCRASCSGRSGPRTRRDRSANLACGSCRETDELAENLAFAISATATDV
jgi:hypothetical protein